MGKILLASKETLKDHIWLRLIVTILIIELFDEVIAGPLFDAIFTHHFWVENIVYKGMEFLIAFVLNLKLLKANVMIARPKRKSIRKLIVLATLIAFFVASAIAIHHPTRAWEALTVGLIAAIPEEFIWRGLVLTYIGQQMSGTTRFRAIWALGISSLLFGLYHMGNLHVQSLDSTLAQVLQTVGLGVILGAIYIKSGNLLNSMLFHFSWDFFATLANGIENGPDSEINWTANIVMFVALCIVGISVVMFGDRKFALIKKLDSKTSENS
ncbi:MAG: CPBP family intramembrane metalloprotease [Furfurilactobacillus sp.]|jgi:membrane protease YdiL (CAAX protease family)|uniref:CPBP family intramembrane glutamic endopeptidase n=1 Tax=Furfurilactobacillus sp. TaxID=2767911 RepID=UPI002583BB3B|nr:CPBP family intramembrane glutamic endopeptidase [Furfurilactobacillus sp.]MCH4011640.1 CPBP family intramembrane metalloprotease [Furfurilactobacillus sp.]MCH4037532.1 CPBP family intramembrane metalloprotease [Furfurilactobacillus sp.]MCH4115832.1 CPBP family intramembrane metalloprotease [Furfurilactobacillus sp.]MCI1339904.1 CPBP family intramembrane metalloprotease [Furfurilactobacillus sp.]MCI1386948.1 CPBP family intramembrane metalloprotease [Furfurilactobacillus sp.]